jgi:hypothetical protein
VEKDKRTVGEQMVGDLGLNSSLTPAGSSDSRLDKIREFHAQDAEAAAAEKEDDP